MNRNRVRTWVMLLMHQNQYQDVPDHAAHKLTRTLPLTVVRQKRPDFAEFVR